MSNMPVTDLEHDRLGVRIHNENAAWPQGAVAQVTRVGSGESFPDLAHHRDALINSQPGATGFQEVVKARGFGRHRIDQSRTLLCFDEVIGGKDARVLNWFKTLELALGRS